jgi:hypothetical protein
MTASAIVAKGVAAWQRGGPHHSRNADEDVRRF